MQQNRKITILLQDSDGNPETSFYVLQMKHNMEKSQKIVK